MRVQPTLDIPNSDSTPGGSGLAEAGLAAAAAVTFPGRSLASNARLNCGRGPPPVGRPATPPPAARWCGGTYPAALGACTAAAPEPPEVEVTAARRSGDWGLSVWVPGAEGTQAASYSVAKGRVLTCMQGGMPIRIVKASFLRDHQDTRHAAGGSCVLI